MRAQGDALQTYHLVPDDVVELLNIGLRVDGFAEGYGDFVSLGVLDVKQTRKRLTRGICLIAALELYGNNRHVRGV